MKSLVLIFISLGIGIMMQAKVVTVTAGGLSLSLSADDRDTVSILTIKGAIDARDFEYMRDSMPMLKVLDITKVKIKDYYGNKGPNSYGYNVDPTKKYYYPTDGIPENAFGYTYSWGGKLSLKTLKFPPVNSIGDWAFHECNGLTGNLKLPSTLTYIGDWAFEECFGYSGSLNLPSSLITIGKDAFYGCSGFTGPLMIPNSVNSIGANAFIYCTGLSGELIIPSSIDKINAGTFYGCSEITDIIISSSVNQINDTAFAFCTGLKSIIIPESIQSIGKKTFYECNNLASIKVGHAIPLSIDTVQNNMLFAGVNVDTCILYVPLGSKEKYKGARVWKDFKYIVEYDAIATVVDEVILSTLKIRQENGTVIIIGGKGENLSVYSLDGVMIYNKTVVNDTTSVKLPFNGLYLINVGDKSLKVVY